MSKYTWDKPGSRNVEQAPSLQGPCVNVILPPKGTKTCSVPFPIFCFCFLFFIFCQCDSYFNVSTWRVLWMRLTFKLWVKEIVLHNVGGSHPILGWRPKLNKKEPSRRMPRNSTAWTSALVSSPPAFRPRECWLTQDLVPEEGDKLVTLVAE